MAEAHYYATSRYAYAWALLKLYDYARAWSGPPFSFGPLALDALLDQGLRVSGDDLEAVTGLLDRAPGLVKVHDWHYT